MTPIEAMVRQSTLPLEPIDDDYPLFFLPVNDPGGIACPACSLVSNADVALSIRNVFDADADALEARGLSSAGSLFVYELPDRDGSWIRVISSTGPPEDSRRWFLSPRKSAGWLRVISALERKSEKLASDAMCSICANLGIVATAPELAIRRALNNPSPAALIKACGGSLWLSLESTHLAQLERGVTGPVLAAASRVDPAPEKELRDLERGWARVRAALPLAPHAALSANRLVDFLLGGRLESPMTTGFRESLLVAIARLLETREVPRRDYFLLAVFACFLMGEPAPIIPEANFSEYAHRWAACHKNNLFTKSKGARFFASECMWKTEAPLIPRVLLGPAAVPLKRTSTPGPLSEGMPPFSIGGPVRAHSALEWVPGASASPLSNPALDWTPVGGIQPDGRPTPVPGTEPRGLRYLGLRAAMSEMTGCPPVALPGKELGRDASIKRGFLVPAYVSRHRRLHAQWESLGAEPDSHPAFLLASVRRSLALEPDSLKFRSRAIDREPTPGRVTRIVNEMGDLMARQGAATWKRAADRFFWDVCGGECYPLTFAGDSSRGASIGALLNWCLSVVDTEEAIDGASPAVAPADPLSFTSQGKLMLVTWLMTVGLPLWIKAEFLDGVPPTDWIAISDFFGKFCTGATPVEVDAPHTAGDKIKGFSPALDYALMSDETIAFCKKTLKTSTAQASYVTLLVLPCVKLTLGLTLGRLARGASVPLTPYRSILAHLFEAYDIQGRELGVPNYAGPITSTVGRSMGKLFYMLVDPVYEPRFINPESHIPEKEHLLDLTETLLFGKLSLI